MHNGIMKAKNQTILIDFYGVICPNTTHLWLRIHAQNFEADKDFYHKLLEKNNRGVITKNEFYEAIAKRTNNDPMAVREGINALISIDQDVVKLLTNLKSNHQIVLVSNSSGVVLRQIIKNYGLANLFDKIFISAEIGTIKPEKTFFDKVLSSLQLAPNSVLFIDDNLKNVQAAEEIGIQSVLYTDEKRLRARLESLGIL